MNSFYLDLSTISLREFFDTLVVENLSPSRQILVEKREERFLTLLASGATTLQGLVEAVKAPRSIERLAKSTDIPGDYLTLLRRQARSWLPKPVPLDRFDVPSDLVDALAEIGISTGYDLFSVVTALQSDQGSGPMRAGAVGAVAHQASVQSLGAELTRLVSMVDLTRVPGVGPVFARIFLSCNVDSCVGLATSDPETLHRDIVAAAHTAGYRGPKITKWDIAACIRFAQRLTNR